jgi:hypothetical protein
VDKACTASNAIRRCKIRLTPPVKMIWRTYPGRNIDRNLLDVRVTRPMHFWGMWDMWDAISRRISSDIRPSVTLGLRFMAVAIDDNVSWPDEICNSCEGRMEVVCCLVGEGECEE